MRTAAGSPFLLPGERILFRLLRVKPFYFSFSSKNLILTLRFRLGLKSFLVTIIFQYQTYQTVVVPNIHRRPSSLEVHLTSLITGATGCSIKIDSSLDDGRFGAAWYFHKQFSRNERYISLLLFSLFDRTLGPYLVVSLDHLKILLFLKNTTFDFQENG